MAMFSGQYHIPSPSLPVTGAFYGIYILGYIDKLADVKLDPPSNHIHQFRATYVCTLAVLVNICQNTIIW